MTPAGPDALTVTATPATVTPGQAVNLTATINDTRFNNSNGAEPTQAIAAAEYYIDTPPWGVGAVAYPMAAADGTFNSTIENVVATVNTTGLGGGRHIVFVRGKDAANNWGAIQRSFPRRDGLQRHAGQPDRVFTQQRTLQHQRRLCRPGDL